MLSTLRGSGSRAEAVLSPTRNSFEVLHTSCAFSASSAGFGSPVEFAHLGVGESAGSTSLLLFVERSLAATPAIGVGVIVSFTKAGCTFCLSGPYHS